MFLIFVVRYDELFVKNIPNKDDPQNGTSYFCSHVPGFLINVPFRPYHRIGRKQKGHQSNMSPYIFMLLLARKLCDNNITWCNYKV